MADRLNSEGAAVDASALASKELNKKGDDKENIVTSTTGSDKDKTIKEEPLEEKTITVKHGPLGEDDDVPEDFFDDFSNKDFLAGLDVVDAWEDDEAQSKVIKSTGKTKSKPSSKEKADKDRKRRSHSRDRKRRRSTERKSRSRDRRSRSRGRKSKSAERKDKRERRDPNKTQRDIQRDKAKCAKDKEAKFISEKLRVVETGLVPPGMEMEFDLNRIDQPKRTSRSPERNRRMHSLSPSPPKRRRYESPVRRRISPRRSSPRRSPPRFSRTVRRSPSPFDRRRYDRRSPSPGGKRYGRRDRDSPPKKRANSFLEELDQKLSRPDEVKLREIQEKINGGPSVSAILSKYAPVPTPVPMPHFPQQPVYDQSFFIGQQEMPSTSFNMQSDYNRMQQQGHYNQYQVPQTAGYQQPTTRPPSMMDSEDVQKLFNDDTISLSKFLQITSLHPDKSKPLDIKDKIKVLTRCQESIKLMTEFAKPTGRFYFKKPMKAPEKPPENKFQSPLKKIPPVRFNFTSKTTKPAEDKVSHPINRLLTRLGIQDEPAVQAMPPAAELTTSSRNIPMLTISSQTEQYQCEDCEARRNVRTTSASVQCQTSVSDFSCQVTEDDFLNTARSALKNVIKNQSFANYTPAQILQSLNASNEQEEVFPAARRLSDRGPDMPSRMGISNNDSFPSRTAMDDYDHFERNEMPRRNASFGGSSFDPRFDSPRDIGVRDFGSGGSSDRFREPTYPIGQATSSFRDHRVVGASGFREPEVANPGNFREATGPNRNFREPDAGNFRESADYREPAGSGPSNFREAGMSGNYPSLASAGTGKYGGRAAVPNRPNFGNPVVPNPSNYGGTPAGRGNFASGRPRPEGANFAPRPLNPAGPNFPPRPFMNPGGNPSFSARPLNPAARAQNPYSNNRF